MFHWGDSLTADADILIYGCNLAESDEGRELLQDIALLTEADVAASTDLTGSGSDADWHLEYHIGVVEAASLRVGNWSGQLDLAASPEQLVPTDSADGHNVTQTQTTLHGDRGADSAIALAENGQQVVVWTSTGSAGVQDDVFFQLYSPSGNKLGTPTKINDAVGFDADQQHSVSVRLRPGRQLCGDLGE